MRIRRLATEKKQGARAMFKMRAYKSETISIDDPFVAAGYNKILRLMKEKKFDVIIESSRLFLKELCKTSAPYPEIYRLYNNIGIAYMQLGCMGPAKKMFDLAVEIEPSYKLAKRNLKLASSKYLDDNETLIALGGEYAKGSGDSDLLAAEAHFLKAFKTALSGKNYVAAKMAASIAADFLAQRGKLDDACGIEDKLVEWCLKNNHEKPVFETPVSFAQKYSKTIKSAAVSGAATKTGESRAISPPSPVKPIKAGRNDPCPCGSGKKYKKCCLAKQHVDERGESLVDRAEISAFLQNEIVEYLHRHIGKKEIMAIFERHRSFVQETGGFSGIPLNYNGDEGQDDGNLPDMSIFDLNDYAIYSHALSDGLTVFDRFLKERSGLLPNRVREVLKEWTTHRYGLWEVVETKPGRWLKAKDCFSDLTIESQGEETSKNTSVYDILMGRIESLSGKGAFTGPSLIVPRILKTDIMAAIERAAMVAGYQSVSDFVHLEMLTARKIVLDIMRDRKPPPFVDYEGHPIKYCTAFYSIEKAAKVTSFFDTRLDFVCDGDYDYGGETRSSEITYSLMKRGPSRHMPLPAKDAPPDAVTLSCQSTIVSRHIPKEEDVLVAGVTIKGRRMEMFAVSEARFDYCRKLLEENLGHCIKFEKEKRLDLKDAMKEDSGKKGKRPEREAIPPDVAERMMAPVIIGYAEEWADKAILALGNKTPRQALNEPSLKPALAELIKDVINHETTGARLQAEHMLKGLGVDAEDLGLKLP